MIAKIRFITAFCLLFALVHAHVASSPTQVRWGTMNIRYDNSDDARHGYGWKVRRDRIVQFIVQHDIDVIGMQEVLHHQAEYLKKKLPQYKMVGVGRDDGKAKGEYAALWYKADKYRALDSGNFWLCEHPDSAGCIGWDAACVRIATWAKLQDVQTGRIFMAVNTHFDHVGVKARNESALLIIRKIKEIVGDKPAVLTGDFNVSDQSEAYQTITTNPFVLYDAFKVSQHHEGVAYTYHDFCNIAPHDAEKIDFIFVTPQIQVLRTIIPQQEKSYILSDHNFHIADLKFE